MRRVTLRVCVGCLLATVFVIVGYMLAVLSFREEAWVDYRSGTRKTTCTLYPFLLLQEDPDDGFRVLFGCSPDENAEWGRIECRHFVRTLDQEAITKAEEMVRGENYLVRSLLYNPVVHDESEIMSKRFYKELREGGVSAAEEYAHGLYWKRAAQQEEEIGQEKKGHH